MKVEDCIGCDDFSTVKHVTNNFKKRNKYLCGKSGFELMYMNRHNYGCPKEGKING